MLSHEYIAGLFDGEGCIIIRKEKNRKTPYYGLMVQIQMVGHSLLKTIQKKYGGSVFYVSSKHLTGKKILSHWNISGIRAKKFIIDIEPYLKLKRKQAKVAIKFANEFCSGYRYGGPWRISTQDIIKKEYYYNKLRQLKE
jgi:hypothetical protein